jgi:hypothetical protein
MKEHGNFTTVAYHDEKVIIKMEIGARHPNVNDGKETMMLDIYRSDEGEYTLCQDLPIENAIEVVQAICKYLKPDEIPEEAIEYLEI